ncbi:hypothetical protein [Streptomyces sp. MBT62]|uniref:hypothetical protein n=1 Tax=Streptomyces sp. MBT62 TaxID=2800410 RepID=UPI0019097A74|nr:hypothetical protein [Streptomyces sp. MBT62]MBK3571427.1 hypothetical protein [Streptomyces sp. MBT62]
MSPHDVHLYYSAPQADTFDDARDRLKANWPPVDGMTVPTYSAAVDRYNKPEHFFQAPSFRLLGVDAASTAAEARSTGLRFTMGSYFDWYDTSEALGFEAAREYVRTSGAKITGPYRESLSSPFSLENRCATPGVNTLTIRTSRHSSMFYLQRRTGVATARGTVHVVPAGEFQPSGGPPDGHTHGGADFDLRSTMIREYAEEFLGFPDSTNPTNRGAPINFQDERRYAEVERALRGGGAKCHYLGVGLYPLTWKPEILMVCVFPDHLFDDVFADMERETYEGHLEGPGGRRLEESDRFPKMIHYLLDRKKQRPYQGLPFDQQTVEEYANDPTTLPAARACLLLAWQHRDLLEIPVQT